MNRTVNELDFEKPLAEIRSNLERLQKANPSKVPDAAAQIAQILGGNAVRMLGTIWPS
jgi:hypothetical protein